MRLITPKGLKENEDFMWRFADQLIDGFVDEGSCEFVERLRRAVHPHRDRRSRRGAGGRPRAVPRSPLDRARARRSQAARVPLRALQRVHRRGGADPRDDVLSGLATATFPDGSTPEVSDAALIAANLFAGGQETTVRMLSFVLRMLGDRPTSSRPREDRDRIPTFIEETLRLESPLRAQFRMARVRTNLAGVDIPAGGTIMLLPGACNRDPACSRTRTSSTSSAPTPASTSASATASTPARGRRWRGPRAG